jgi:hypothetical protein
MRGAVVLVFGLFACDLHGGDASGTVRHPPPPTDEDQFVGPRQVRITAPSDGETVEDAFDVDYEAGDKVATVRISVDGDPVSGFVRVAHGPVAVELESGRHTLTLVAYDDASAELSRDAIAVRVLADASAAWVSITSPADGSNPTNPVQFAVAGSADVDHVELTADGYALGSVAPDGVLTYTFAGTGYERQIEAVAFDRSGAELSRDDIAITPEAGNVAPPSDFNDMVLALVDEYPTDSSIDYYWPQGTDWSGSTQDIDYRGVRVANSGGFRSCYCVGLTWEIYLRSWQEFDRSTGGDADDLNGMTADDVLSMRTDWFVRELDGPGASVAFENYGLGLDVQSFDDWRPGDFVQLWRTSGSGHNVIFIDWVTDDDGNRIGMKYWACNGTSSTDGPGYNEEYFGSFNGALDPSKMYAGRAYMPGDWSSPR